MASLKVYRKLEELLKKVKTDLKVNISKAFYEGQISGLLHQLCDRDMHSALLLSELIERPLVSIISTETVSVPYGIVVRADRLMSAIVHAQHSVDHNPDTPEDAAAVYIRLSMRYDDLVLALLRFRNPPK